jgi:hypothetical protein
VLGLAARNRQVLTYDILGKLIGVPRAGLGRLLEPIQSYCLIEGLPALTALVVNESGLPGTDFTAAEDVPKELQRVHSHDWLEERVPTQGDLLTAVRRRPSCGIPEAAEDGE